MLTFLSGGFRVSEGSYGQIYFMIGVRHTDFMHHCRNLFTIEIRFFLLHFEFKAYLPMELLHTARKNMISLTLSFGKRWNFYRQWRRK